MTSQCLYSPSCIRGLPTQNLHGPKGYTSYSGPTLGHHGIIVDSLLVWAAHREPAESPKLWALSGQARTGPD